MCLRTFLKLFHSREYKIEKLREKVNEVQEYIADAMIEECELRANINWYLRQFRKESEICRE